MKHTSNSHFGSRASRTALAVVSALSCQMASAQGGLTLARTGEAPFGPVPITQAVEGVPISMQVYAFLSVTSAAEPIEVAVRLVADLSDLQAKAGALVDTVSLPRDNCAHFGVDNLVARIWEKKLFASGATATLKLNGDVDVWTCAKNPIPCTKVEDWQLVVYDCNPPIKNLNLQQPFDATLPFQLRLVDPQTLAIELGKPEVDLGGTLGGVTGGILRIAGVDLNSHVQRALEDAIDPGVLRKALPPALLPFNPVLTRAELASESGTLAANVEMKLTVDARALEGLGAILQGGSIPEPP